MNIWVIRISFVLIAAALSICLYRVFRGPNRLDRIIAFDAISVCSVGMLVLISLRTGVDFPLEVMLLISLLGFITPTAFMDYTYNHPDPQLMLEEPPELEPPHD